MKIKKVVFIMASTLCEANSVNSSENVFYVEAQKRQYGKDVQQYADYHPYATRSIDHLPVFTPTDIETDKYGGRVDIKGKSTGFYHVEKINGRWWVVDPAGNACFNMAVNALSKGKKRQQHHLKKAFGTTENWIRETAKMINELGFNGAGAWSNNWTIIEYNKTADNPLSYTVNLNFMSSYGKKRGGTYQAVGHTGYPNETIFVFDPEFKDFCFEYAQRVKKYRDDPNLFGYFTDNELPLHPDGLRRYLELPEDDHGYQGAANWLKEQGISENDITEAVELDFHAYYIELYFKTVNEALKSVDPKHMNLGARVHAEFWRYEKMMKAMAHHIDIISMNYYNVWSPVPSEMQNMRNWFEKPFIVTEFYTKGEDSGMGNQTGAGWIVKNQKDRGYFYHNYVLGLIEAGNCVGWHYFKYRDNDPNDPNSEPSNRDSNKGLVTIDFKPYTPMLEEMKKINRAAYALSDYFDQLRD